MSHRLSFALALACSALALSCKGNPSSDPPVHLVPDMDDQPKYRPESANAFFDDGRAMRPLIEGTVARAHLDEDDVRFRGTSADGTFVATVPLPVDEKLLARGEQRFGIYCTPCHDATGSGRGMAVRRGFPQPVDLTGDRVRGLVDGEIFHAITSGVRNMPSYRAQIPVDDRWAIVAWVRVLQKSQHGLVADVPVEMTSAIEPEGATP